MPYPTATLLCRARPVLALAALLLLPALAPAQQPTPRPPVTLSLEQALGLAEENSPLFLQQRNNAEVARSSVRAAYGSLLPTANVSSGFGYTASGERRFGSVEFGRQPDYYSSEFALGMSYQLSGSTLLLPSVARSSRRATERQVAGAAANLEAEVTQQYLSVLQARERVAQAEREVERTGEYLRLAEARLEVGAGTPLDVRRAEVQRGRAEVALVQARNNTATAALNLGQLIGVPLEPSVELTSRFGIFQPGWEAETLVAVALQKNPALLAARATSDAASTSVRSARTQYLPSLNFSLGMRGSVYQAGDIDPLVQGDLFSTQQRFSSCRQGNALGQLIGQAPQDCSRFDINNPAVVQQIRAERREQNSGFPFDYRRQPLGASVSISLPIFTGFSRQLQVDQAQASAADARYQVRAEELRLRQQVEAAVLGVETAYQTALLQEKVRENAQEELRMAQERFRFGAASSIEVTDAQTNLAQAEQAQIDAVYTFHQTLAALEVLVGQPLRSP
jgi:outer membrane protein